MMTAHQDGHLPLAHQGPGVCPPPAAGLLLAAGAGRRYGEPKAFAPVPGLNAGRLQREPGADELMVERGVRTLRDGGCDPIVVVLGAQAHRAPPLPSTHLVVNEDWASGLGSSLRAGLAAMPEQVQACVVLLVDTPGITPAAVRRVGATATAHSLRVATYLTDGGHPVLLGRAHWAGVAELAVGDVGARPYLARHDVEAVPCDDISDGADVDIRRA